MYETFLTSSTLGNLPSFPFYTDDCHNHYSNEKGLKIDLIMKAAGLAIGVAGRCCGGLQHRHSCRLDCTTKCFFDAEKREIRRGLPQTDEVLLQQSL